MKNMTSLKSIKLIGFGLLFITFSLSSCQKDVPPAPDTTAGTTTELKVAADFDWKTSREITLNVIGLKEVNPAINNTFYVNSSAGVTYYKDLLTMNQDYTIKFAVPSTETTLVFNYGSKTKTVEITSSSLTYDYITE